MAPKMYQGSSDLPNDETLKDLQAIGQQAHTIAQTI